MAACDMWCVCGVKGEKKMFRAMARRRYVTVREAISLIANGEEKKLGTDQQIESWIRVSARMHPSDRHLEYLAKTFQDLPRSCKDLAKIWQDLARSGKILEEIRDRIQDVVKISKMKSKIFSRFPRSKILSRYPR